MATKAKLESAEEQIAVMERLSQKAAAWLLSLNAKTVRDNPRIPRNEDGTYDASKLLTWSKDRIGIPRLSDNDMELLFRMEELVESRFDNATEVFAIADAMLELKRIYGPGILASFAEILFDHWSAEAAKHREETRPLSRAEIEHKVRRLVQQELEADTRTSLELPVVCHSCGKIRCGNTWAKSRQPEDERAVKGLCPDCK